MRLTPSISRRGEAGFTLIELTIGAALMALILGTAYACLNSGLAARRLLEPRLDAVQGARVALALMTADLRAVCPLSKEDDFVGMDREAGGMEADNVNFGTMNFTPRRVGEGDFCQTSYYVDRDPETGEWVLWRRRNPRIGPDAFEGGSREELVRGVRQLKLEYYDGFDWYDTWGDVEGNGKRESSLTLQPNLYGIPEAVRITLALTAEGRAPKPAVAQAEEGQGSGEGLGEGPRDVPLVFTTLVRINAMGGGGSGSGSGTGTGTGTGTEGTPTGGPSEGGVGRPGGGPGGRG